MKKIIFFRHGQTDWNLQDLVQGHTDIPLNPQGKEQANVLGEKLKTENIEHIYTSDLQRAAQTAQIVAEYVHCPITYMHELREMHGGVMQGKTKAEFREHPLYCSWASEDEIHDHVGFEGGETKKQAKDRAMNALQTIIALPNYNTVAICSHGVIITYMLRMLLNKSVEKLGNAEYIVLNKDSHGWSMYKK
jgi:broad specificity phosphatase PhoE